MRALATNECKGTCGWARAQADGQPAELEGQPLFECTSCHSEWVPSESWIPRDADGSVAPEVSAAREGAGIASEQPIEGSTGSW